MKEILDKFVAEAKTEEGLIKSRFIVIISGSRDFVNYARFSDILEESITPTFSKTNTSLIFGDCKGTDAMAKRFAKENGYEYTEFVANWDKHKKRAGPIRNGEMARYGDVLVAFKYDHSKGTKDMIRKMRRLNKPVVDIDL